MSDIISDHQLTKACDDIAAEIFGNMLDDLARDETPEDKRDDMNDRAHEDADGRQWTIYTHYALLICAHCNTDAGEEFVEDVGPPKPLTLASLASAIVYGEIRSRIEAEIDRLIEEWEDTRPEEPEDDEAAA